MFLKGKTALITGGGSGIGKQIALTLAAQGADIALTYLRNTANAEKVSSEITRLGRFCRIYQADLTDPADVGALFSNIEKDSGNVTILINNVGNFILKPVIRHSFEEWADMINSNLSSVFYCTKAAYPGMCKAGGGQIINIGFASSDKVKAAPNIGPYAAAKTGLISLTKTLSKELINENIRVNAVSPGLIDNGKLTDRMFNKTEKMHPAGKLGSPHDIAHAVLFLLNPDSNYISGANLIVSAGWDV